MYVLKIVLYAVLRSNMPGNHPRLMELPFLENKGLSKFREGGRGVNPLVVRQNRISSKMW